MAKETALRCMVYVGTGLVIAEAAFLAFVVIPRLAMHQEAIRLGSVRSSWFFVKIQLIVAATLLAFIIPNRHDVRKIKVFLIIAGIVVIVLSLPIFSGAVFYLESYRFYDVAILEFMCVGANLIAGILFITVPIMLRRSSSAK